MPWQKSIWSKSVFLTLIIFVLSACFMAGCGGFMFWDIALFECPMKCFLILDKISFSFSLTVALVSFFVFMYAHEYMGINPMKRKFIITLFSFVISMFLLIFSADLFWLMIGWDGLGLSSMFLIFFFQNSKSFNSGMVTFLCNRMGDFFFLSSISVLFFFTTNLMSVGWAPSLMILIGAFSKSAQIPFSAWLPLAMAAPTPVSALVHSSTLVTAGVYVLIRFHNFLSPESKFWMCLLSSLTLTLGGSSSISEFDLKKIIALSTLSHIGMMMFFLSLGMIESTTLHMVVHAFFKSLLFMIAGCIIHENGGEQDIRLISVTHLSAPMNISLISSSLSMMGTPFLSGFYSKETFLNLISMKKESLLFTLFLVSVFLTCAYTSRMLVTLFSVKKAPLSHQSGSYWVIFLMLSIASLTGGNLSWAISSQANEEVFSLLPKSMLFSLFLAGVIFGVFFPSWKLTHSKGYQLFMYMWGMSKGIYIFQNMFPLSWTSLYKLDSKGLIDFAPNLLVKSLELYSSQVMVLTSSGGFCLVGLIMICLFFALF